MAAGVAKQATNIAKCAKLTAANTVFWDVSTTRSYKYTLDSESVGEKQVRIPTKGNHRLVHVLAAPATNNSIWGKKNQHSALPMISWGSHKT